LILHPPYKNTTLPNTWNSSCMVSENYTHFISILFELVLYSMNAMANAKKEKNRIA
jgi:hypothetical protein